MKINQLIQKFKEDRPNDTLVYVARMGAHQFGLESDNSDQDFKGIYIYSK